MNDCVSYFKLPRPHNCVRHVCVTECVDHRSRGEALVSVYERGFDLREISGGLSSVTVPVCPMWSMTFVHDPMMQYKVHVATLDSRLQHNILCVAESLQRRLS